MMNVKITYPNWSQAAELSKALSESSITHTYEAPTEFVNGMIASTVVEIPDVDDDALMSIVELATRSTPVKIEVDC